MSINQIQDEIIKEFSGFEDWMDRYSLLIEYGNELEPMNEADKNDTNLIDGCQSKVWITAEVVDDKVIYHGDSDAILVKGIVALLLRVFSNHTAQEIVDANLYVLDEIQLKEHLSPTLP